MSLSEIVSQKVKKLRKEQKLSQESLASKAKISVSYVSMLERGQRVPALSTIDKLGEAFGVPPIQLLKVK
jgi:transcriptional regulator with XRE-family HTH domain